MPIALRILEIVYAASMVAMVAGGLAARLSPSVRRSLIGDHGDR